MKSLFTFFAFALITGSIFAQGAGAVLFAEMGEPFTAYLNGQKMNEKPAVNVRLDDLTGEFYKVRIDFEDGSLPDLMSNMMVQQGIEVTYVIKMGKKGEYQLKYFAEAPYAGAAPGKVVIQSDIPQEPVDAEFEEEIVIEQEIVRPGNADVQVTETVVTKTGPGSAKDGENIRIDMNLAGVGININVDGEMDGAEIEQTQTITTTTTTTTKRTGGDWEEVSDEPVPAQPVKSGPSGCASSMSASEYNEALNSIKSKSFSDSKLTLAKQITKSKCVTADQVKGIMAVLDFEATKLEYAKYAYDYTFDKDNYYTVNDAFDFESSIDELNQYIESK